jgi:hypothetical protein
VRSDLPRVAVAFGEQLDDAPPGGIRECLECGET